LTQCRPQAAGTVKPTLAEQLPLDTPFSLIEDGPFLCLAINGVSVLAASCWG
jgi:hypothetical protein